MKDNFSTQSSGYARFRPGYPTQLYDFLYEQCAGFDTAWDCATGNGQIAAALAERFRQVEATDISENQLKNAIQKPNIRYQLAAAEASLFPQQSLDLITVGQAAHWFDLEKFYAEVKRVLKPGGILALVGYNLLRVDPETEAWIEHLYENILGAQYWDPERRLVETAYQTIDFPFTEIDFPEIASEYEWTSDQLLGYLNTWSAVQHFTRVNGVPPISDALVRDLKEIWPDGVVKTVRFPIFGRVGRG